MNPRKYLERAADFPVPIGLAVLSLVSSLCYLLKGDFNTSVILSTIISVLFVFYIMALSFYRKSQKELDSANYENKALIRKVELLEQCRKNTAGRIRQCLDGARVIVKSNEPEPLHIGTIIRFQQFTQGNNWMPIVVFDGDPKEYLCMAAIMPYNEKLLNKVKDMPPKEQWETLKEISLQYD